MDGILGAESVLFLAMLRLLPIACDTTVRSVVSFLFRSRFLCLLPSELCMYEKVGVCT